MCVYKYQNVTCTGVDGGIQSKHTSVLSILLVCVTPYKSDQKYSINQVYSLQWDKASLAHLQVGYQNLQHSLVQGMLRTRS